MAVPGLSLFGIHWGRNLYVFGVMEAMGCSFLSQSPPDTCKHQRPFSKDLSTSVVLEGSRCRPWYCREMALLAQQDDPLLLCGAWLKGGWLFPWDAPHHFSLFVTFVPFPGVIFLSNELCHFAAQKRVNTFGVPTQYFQWLFLTLLNICLHDINVKFSGGNQRFWFCVVGK